jgi:DNA invertase Pin-like site-specific DNA recombinase
MVQAKYLSLDLAKFARWGHSMLACMEILSIASQQQINISAVKGNWRLDNSIQSKMVAMAFSIAAEIERDLISQRPKENGIKLGRPAGVQKSKLC